VGPPSEQSDPEHREGDDRDHAVIAAQAVAGLAVPLLVAGLILARAARITAVQAMRDHGVTAPGPRSARLAGRLSERIRLPRLALLAIRNAFRRRGRLLLAVTALAFGGATFMAAGNVANGLSDTFVEQTIAAEPYDVSAVLDQPYPNDTVDKAVGAVPGVARGERWLSTSATAGSNDTILLAGAPLDSPTLRLRILAGRWLTTGPSHQIVVSTAFVKDHPGTAVGSALPLRIGDRASTWQVVGVAVQLGGPAAWAAYDDLADEADEAGASNVVRLVATAHDDTSVVRIQQDLEHALSAAGITVVSTRSLTDIRKVLVAHQVLFVVFLNLMTLLSVVVGGLGLAITLTVAIIERTREIGVLRAVGATNRSLLGLVAIEAAVIGVVSWVLAALLLAVPTTLAFGALFGNLLLDTPIAFTINGWTIAGWLALVLVISTLASLLPARRAKRMTVSTLLAYE